jgi:hypothetical protein
MTTVFLASDYRTREQLENRIRQVVGGDTTPKPDFQIQGSADELSNLNLSESSTIFGVGDKII